jgi:hypothetical protein
MYDEIRTWPRRFKIGLFSSRLSVLGWRGKRKRRGCLFSSPHEEIRGQGKTSFADVAQRQSTAFVKQKTTKNPGKTGVFAFSTTPVAPRKACLRV